MSQPRDLPSPAGGATDDGGFGLTPLAGGHGGETFLARAPGEQSVVRLYVERGAVRGPEAPAVDAAVLRLVRGLLPVADVLEVRRARDGLPGMLVTTVLPGTRLDLLLPTFDAGARATVGSRLGLLLGRLATMPMPRPGQLVDADLRIEPWPVADLVGLVEAQRSGSALAAWAPSSYDGLLGVARHAQTVLDGVRRTCLVHSDVNPKNLLVDASTLEVTGLVDWEFAHAGWPGADLGNLLRFERDEPFADAVVEAYRAHVPDAGPDLLDQARAADLVALVDLASRRGQNPVTEQAHELLLAVARSGDLHAVP